MVLSKGSRIRGSSTTNRHYRKALGIRATDEGNVSDLGREIGENRETSAREAAGFGKNGYKRPSIWHTSREKQILLSQSQ